MTTANKLISPIIHLLTIIPTFIAIIITLATLEKTIGLSSHGTGKAEAIILPLFYGTIFFWLSNKFMSWQENLKHPTLETHFRQSFVFYVLAIFATTEFLKTGIYGGLKGAYIFIFAALSAYAILINAIFLIKMKKNSKL